MTTLDQRTVRAYFDAVATRNLDDTFAGVLIGAAPESARKWQDGISAEPSEDYTCPDDDGCPNSHGVRYLLVDATLKGVDRFAK
jgi:hypothetical protein